MKNLSRYSFYDWVRIERDFDFEIDDSFLIEIRALLHVEEFNARSIFCLGICILVTILCLSKMEFIVHILQAPAIGVKFMQLGPGEYFITSIKIALSIGFLAS